MYNMTVLALIFQMCKSREELSKIVKFWPFYNPALVPMWARVMSFIVYVLLTPKLHHIKLKRFQEQVKTVKCWHTTTDKKSIAIGYLSFKKKMVHILSICVNPIRLLWNCKLNTSSIESPKCVILYSHA